MIRSFLRYCIFAALLFVIASNAAWGQSTHTLTTGTGDASLSVTVNGVGAFAGGIYDPVGPVAAASTTFSSEMYFRIGLTGTRNVLSASSTITGSATSCTSSFTTSGLSFTLVQTVAPMFVGSVQTGSTLTQTYTITNPGTSAVDFDLVRYYDGDLLFDGTLTDGGGRLPGPPETLFETDAGGGGSTSTTFVGIRGDGGTIPATDRFRLLDFSIASNVVASGAPLSGAIAGDGNADGFIDAGSEYDVVLLLRNVFNLAPGASTTYTSTTIFGSGTPASVTSGVNVAESGGSTSVGEGAATDTYTVVLNSAPTANVTITANPGPQLSVTPAVLTFTPANWNVAQTVTITALDDAAIEGAHSGTITHTVASTDTVYNGVSVASVTATIADNDVTPPPPPPPPPPSGNSEGSYTGAGFFGFGGRIARVEPPLLETPSPVGSELRVRNLAIQRQVPAERSTDLLAFVLFIGSLVSAVGVGAIVLVRAYGSNS